MWQLYPTFVAIVKQMSFQRENVTVVDNSIITIPLPDINAPCCNTNAVSGCGSL